MYYGGNSVFAGVNMAFWITLFRGILAVALGIILIFQPEKTRWFLGNFMGLFWLASGAMSLRWGLAGERSKGLSLLAGVVGVIAGLAMLSRTFVANYVAETTMFTVLGVIVLLTGIMHVSGGFKKGPDHVRRWSWTAFLIGAFEIILGLIVIISPLDRSPFFYFVAVVWAMLGGLILIGDALRVRRLSQQDA